MRNVGEREMTTVNRGQNQAHGTFRPSLSFCVLPQRLGKLRCVLAGACFGEVSDADEEVVGHRGWETSQHDGGLQPLLPLGEDLRVGLGVIAGRVAGGNGSDANQELNRWRNCRAECAARLLELRGETIFGIALEFPRLGVDQAAAVRVEEVFEIGSESVSPAVRPAERDWQRLRQKAIAEKIEPEPIRNVIPNLGTNYIILSAQEMAENGGMIFAGRTQPESFRMHEQHDRVNAPGVSSKVFAQQGGLRCEAKVTERPEIQRRQSRWVADLARGDVDHAGGIANQQNLRVMPRTARFGFVNEDSAIDIERRPRFRKEIGARSEVHQTGE